MIVGGEPLRKDEVWRAAMMVNVIFVFAQIVGAISFPLPLPAPLSIARMVEATWCLTLLVLLLYRGATSVRFGLWTYGLSVVPHFVLFWTMSAAREAAGRSWEPFWRQRVMCFIFAMVSPGEVIITTAIIVAVAVETCIEYWVEDLRLSLHLERGEPWLTVGVAALALWILYYRAYLMARERRFEAHVREALALERLARVSIAVRDLANSPLQLLLIGMGLLLRTVPGERILLTRMNRAVGRLLELNHLLEPHTRDLHWRDEWSSPDSVKVIEDELHRHH